MKFRVYLSARVLRLGTMNRYSIEFKSFEGVVDYLEVDSCGVLRIHTWYHDFSNAMSPRPVLYVDGGVELRAINFFRVLRDDVNEALQSVDKFHGVVFEYLCPESSMQVEERQIELYWESECICAVKDISVMRPPSYPYLLNDERVFHRDWIYCSGLPVDYLNEEVLALAQTLSGPILDFGCGTGVMTAALRRKGLEVKGLELDRPEIRKALPKDRTEFVDLYDGSLPLPFEDVAFESILLSEVLEHLEDPEPVMEELTRVCKSQILVTVPDLCGVPLNHKNGVVPWHLLESTHVNFFNPRSLEVFLSKWFPHIELFRIGRSQTNDTQWWGGLMALARK